MPRPRLVGITGTIGSGKSVVGEMLTRRGYMVIDTDNLVHKLFASDAHLQKTIADRFGNGVMTARGEIDRSKLGAIVFADEEARKDLEAIVHPAVLQECDRLVKEHSDKTVLFVLVPLLFEAGVDKRYDEVWTVLADEPVLKARLAARTNLPPEELESRIAAQMPQSEKAARSHRVINNSGSLAETESQLEALLKQLPVSQKL